MTFGTDVVRDWISYSHLTGPCMFNFYVWIAPKLENENRFCRNGVFESMKWCLGKLKCVREKYIEKRENLKMVCKTCCLGKTKT